MKTMCVSSLPVRRWPVARRRRPGHCRRTSWFLVAAWYRLAAWRLPAAWCLLAALALLGARAVADQPTYAIGADPISLGTKALEQGHLDEAKTRFLEAMAHDYQVPRAKYGLAEVAVREGRYDDAEPLYREAQALHLQEDKKDYPEALADLGLLLLRYDRDEEAAQLFQQALKSDASCWDAQYGQARLLLAQKQWDQAKALLDKGAGKQGAKDGADKYHYGMALYQLGKGNLAEAEKEALLALHLNAWDPDHATLVGRIYEKRDAPTLAIDAYEKSLAAPGMTPTAPMLRTLGGLYQKVGRYNEARDQYLRAIAIDSTYAPALKDLADLFLLAKQYDKAARTYLRTIALEHDDIDALMGLATSCIEIHRYDQAVEAARAVVVLDSTRTDARVALARAGIHSRDPATRSQAAAIFASMPGAKQWQPPDYIALAEYQTEKKQYAAARANLQKALDLDPRQAGAYFQLGVIDMSDGRPQSAITNLDKAIDLDPDAPIYYLNRGIAFFQMQRVADAIPDFRRTLQRDSKLTISRLLLAQALTASDSLDAAEQQYRQVLEAEPGNAQALRGLGFCYIRRSNYAEAVKTYQTATTAEPRNADGWAGLGDAYLGQNNYSAAEEAFAKAKAIDPNNATLKQGLELLSKARQATDR